MLHLDTDKIGLVSDSHGAIDLLNKAVHYLKKEGVTTLLHLGDFAEDIEKISADGLVLHAVYGNMDPAPSGYPAEAEFENRGQKIWVTHGHIYEVHYNNRQLIDHARQNHYTAVFYGHTHEPYCQNVEQLLLCNPGTVWKGSCGIVYFSQGQIRGELKAF